MLLTKGAYNVHP